MLYVALPLVERLSGEAEHEVDADVLETCFAQCFHGVVHLFGVVSPANGAQLLVGECLCTEAHAVESHLPNRQGIFFGDVVGVALDGRFRILRHSVHLIYIIYNGSQLRYGELRRCSSAEVDGRYFAAWLSHRHFVDECRDITIAQRQQCGAVEAAIDASALAERYVYVQRFHLF